MGAQQKILRRRDGKTTTLAPNLEAGVEIVRSPTGYALAEAFIHPLDTPDLENITYEI